MDDLRLCDCLVTHRLTIPLVSFLQGISIILKFSPTIHEDGFKGQHRTNAPLPRIKMVPKFSDISTQGFRKYLHHHILMLDVKILYKCTKIFKMFLRIPSSLRMGLTVALSLTLLLNKKYILSNTKLVSEFSASTDLQVFFQQKGGFQCFLYT